MRAALKWTLLAFCASAVMAEDAEMELMPAWEYVADTVMGGISTGNVTVEIVQGRRTHRLTGDVSTRNNGGFIQMAFDVNDGNVLDASRWTGVAIDVHGNGEVYDLRLRTDQLTRPWQSFRTDFTVTPEWTTVKVPFVAFQSHRTEEAFDPARLRRIGILAIGREFSADVAVSGIRFYR